MSVIPKEVLSDYKELFEQANKLVEDESKSDPPTDPYRSHYKARDVLLTLKKLLDDQLVSLQASEADGGHEELVYKAMLGFVQRDLGRIYIFTEESSEGEKYLVHCLELLEPHKQRPECIIAYMGAINELSIVLGSRQEYKKAADLLLKAEQSYQAFKQSGEVALNLTELHTPDETPGGGNQELENIYTLCGFYLAQMYGHIGEPEKSAQCCHRTLYRQLQYKTYDPIDFALNTATLSQYYIGKDRFKEARHHLAAATIIMAEHEATMLKPEMSEQQRADYTETFKHRYADVARCWAKYGLSLLQVSRERLLADDDEDEDGNKLNKATAQLALEDQDYRFVDLDLAACERRVSCDFCLTFDDAKLVFHFVNEWLDVAKDYYKAETEATEYAKIMQDFAEAYEAIAFFEDNPENQAKMQKRRAKYLEDLLDLLDPVFYLKICRECWYVAGTAHAAVTDIRLDNMKAQQSPTPEEVKKVNQSCLKAIKHFESYAKSYLVDNTEKWRSNMELCEQRLMLYAHFHIGRLYYKLIGANPQQQLEQLNQCLRYYKRFSEACAEHKEASQPMHGEIGVVREMLELLPLKIMTVKRRLE
ncbi:hypothetical protein KR215_011643 [Drosophila sulfurigaster]|nr:hypothetical protein KR215_011643 [Drosophila sulfurigaster]